MEIDKREYNTVVLAALLHDIGKFTEKQLSQKEHKHPWYSEEFINNNLSFLKNKDWIDFVLVKLFVKRHHEYENAWVDEYLIQKFSDDHYRKLAYIVGHADSASSRERSDRRFDELFLGREAQRFPLDSVFGEVFLQEKDLNAKEWFDYYENISAISPVRAFPKQAVREKV